MAPKLQKLDPISEMLALATHQNKKNIIVAALELEGPLDAEAMKQAAQETLESFPQFMSCLKEIRKGRKFYLYREVRADLPFQVTVFDLKTGETQGVLEPLLDHLRPSLDRDWDLFQEHGGRVHIARISEDKHVLVTVVHHSAGDAATTTEFAKAILVRYENIIGKPRDRSKETEALSTMRKRRARVKKRKIRDAVADFILGVTPLFIRPTLPVGSGDPRDERQFHIKRLCSKEDTERIMAQQSKRGAPLTDILVCSADLAIDQWNEARNIPPGSLATTMTVNMRGRFEGFDNPNNSGMIFFRSQPEERKDPVKFARSVALTRISYFRKHQDLRFFINVSNMNDNFRIMPFHMRRRVVHFFMQRHQFSITTTLLGVILPEFKKGRPTGRSIPPEFGDVTLTEIHGMGYKLLSRTHLVLMVYLYQDRLNLVLDATACHFTRQEAEEFMDLILANIQGDPHA